MLSYHLKPRQPFLGLALSPDGSLLAVAQAHHGLTLRAATTGATVAQFPGRFEGTPHKIAFSSNGELCGFCASHFLVLMESRGGSEVRFAALDAWGASDFYFPDGCTILNVVFKTGVRRYELRELFGARKSFDRQSADSDREGDFWDFRRTVVT